MASDRTVALALLPEIQSMLARLGSRSGFRLISGFADRHGAWEMRLAATHPASTGFISFACDEMPKGDALRCEISAGFTKGKTSAKHIVGTFTLKSLNSDESGLIERKFSDAVKASGVSEEEMTHEAEPPRAATMVPARYALGK